MKNLVILCGVAVAGWLIYSHFQQLRDIEAEQRFHKMKPIFDEAQRQYIQDSKGPLGRDAKVACRRVAGISVDAETAKDIINAGYSADAALKYVECVTNYMYPIDARKIEQYDREIAKGR